MAANSMQIQLNGEPYELPAGQTVADLLARLELGDAIPEPLYRSIAEIIAFAWYLKGKCPPGFQAASDSGSAANLPLLSGPGH